MVIGVSCGIAGQARDPEAFLPTTAHFHGTTVSCRQNSLPREPVICEGDMRDACAVIRNPDLERARERIPTWINDTRCATHRVGSHADINNPIK